MVAAVFIAGFCVLIAGWYTRPPGERLTDMLGLTDLIEDAKDD